MSEESPSSASAIRALQHAAQSLLERGESLSAYDAIVEALRQYPADVRLRQLHALALARTGATEAAREALQQLIADAPASEETLGLLARTHKDSWAHGVDAGERTHHLQRAFATYRESYHRFGGMWSGINAAALGVLLGDRDTAGALARRVRAQCLAEHRAGHPTSSAYWTLATLGEAALVLGDRHEAEMWYAQAAAVAGRRVGDVASTRRNARLVYQQIGLDGDGIEAALRVPPVVVFAGHLIDRPGRSMPRFPQALEADVRQALRDRVGHLAACFGYSSAACGADLLFLETVVDLHGETTIVLPYERAQFQADSVGFALDGQWTVRFERALERAHDVVTASDQRIGRGGLSYEYGLLVLDGLAAVRADELDTDLVSMAVWDGLPGDGAGGTAAAVERWRRLGRRIEIIDLRALQRLAGAEVVTSAADETIRALPESDGSDSSDGFEPRIVALLFADVQGFSRLTEREIPLFVRHFLGMVSAVVGELPGAPIMTNTWGDGLYFVFAEVRDAGECALRLCEAVARFDWRAAGLSSELGLRIGLHAGPAYQCIDPVTGRPNFLGAHVSRAARIEPITPAGQVYASGAFAALARAEQIDGFACSYVGRTPLAKGYGTFPTYAVRRRAPGTNRRHVG